VRAVCMNNVALLRFLPFECVDCMTTLVELWVDCNIIVFCIRGTLNHGLDRLGKAHLDF
jgi:hypothetical protein